MLPEPGWLSLSHGRGHPYNHHVNWIDSYHARLCTPEQPAALIKSDSRVFLSGNCSVPRQVLAALVERAPELTSVEIIQVLTMGNASYVATELAGHLRVNTLFISDD